MFEVPVLEGPVFEVPVFEVPVFEVPVLERRQAEVLVRVVTLATGGRAVPESQALQQAASAIVARERQRPVRRESECPGLVREPLGSGQPAEWQPPDAEVARWRAPVSAKVPARESRVDSVVGAAAHRCRSARLHWAAATAGPAPVGLDWT